MSETSAPTKRPSVRRLLVTVAALVAIAAGATACQPPGCAKDCITSLSVNPGATTTSLVTTDKAKIHLAVYSDSARTIQALAKVSGTFATSHTLSHAALDPDRTYWFRATATDEAGKSHTELGSFRTQKRTVSVKITRIKLVDDSDSVGSGEVDFGLRVGSTDFGQVYADDDMSSGTDVTGLSIVRTVTPKAPASFVISVEGRDDDCEGIGSLCTGGTQFSYTSGSSDDWDWATASTAAIVAPSTNGTGSWSVATTSHAIKFQVYGTWSVSYAA